MSRLTLNAAAFIRLGAQLRLNGTFHHTLRNDQRVGMVITVAIEQCTTGIHVQIRAGSSRNSITLHRDCKTKAARLACYIESIANGEDPTGVTELNEEQLASAVEVTLRKAIRTAQGTHYLPVEGMDDLSVHLRKNSGGRLIATLAADGVSLQVLLPRSNPEAYSMLAESVERFIAGHRTAKAA